MSAPTSPRSRARRVVGAVAATFGLFVTFVLALVVGVYLHIDSPRARRVLVTQVDAVLKSAFLGTIRIDRVGRIGLNGIDAVDARVIDPDGVEVVHANGIHARLSLIALARSALFGKGDIAVLVTSVTIDDVGVNVDSAPDGSLRIANAFATRPSPTPSASTASGPSRGVYVSLDDIVLTHAWVHGTLPSAPTLDADADAVHAAVLVASGHVTVDVSRASLLTRGMPRNANVVGEGAAKVTVPSAAGNAVGVSASLRGSVGGIATNAEVVLDGDRIDAMADVPDFAATKLQALVPEAPLFGTIGVHAEGHGTLARLEAVARARLDEGTLDANAIIALGDDVTIDAKADARNMDVRSFSPAAPASALTFTSTATLVLRHDKTIRASYVLDSSPGHVGDNVVPAASLHGTFEEHANAKGDAQLSAHVEGRVDEAGAPTAIVADLRSEGGTSVVEFDLHSTIPRLEAFARVPKIGTGSVKAHARGRIAIPSLVLDTTVDADVDSFANGPARVAHAAMHGRATGAPQSLSIDGVVTAKGVAVNGLVFTDVAADAHGATRLLEVALSARGDNAPKIQARSTVDLSGVPTLRGAKLSLARDDVTMIASVESARLAADDLRVDGLVVEGVGEPVHAQLRHTPMTTFVHADSRSIDVARIGRLFRVTKTPVGGQGSLDVDATVTGSTIAGHVIADFAHLSLPQISQYIVDASLHADASMSGRRVSGHVRASAANVGNLDITTVNAELAGNAPIALDSWKDVWGAAQIHGELDIECILGLLPKDALPVDDVTGTIVLRGKVARDSIRDLIPAVAITVATRNLVISGGRAGARAKRTSDLASWSLSGIDVRVDANVDGAKGGADLIVRLLDARGELVAAEAKSNAVPFAALLAPQSDLVALLMKTPIVANGELHRRRLDSLRAFMDTHDAQGDIEASFGFAGTIVDPKIELFAKAWDIKAPSAPITMKMGADMTAHYDGAKADAEVVIQSSKGVILTGNARGTMKIPDLLNRKPDVALPWTASADVHAMSFPLGAIAALSERQIRGKITGNATLKGLHEDASVQLDAKVADLQLGSSKLSGATLSARTDGPRLRASARLDQTDGYLRASAAVGIKWGSQVVPTRDDAVKTQASLDASRFRISAMLPFVDSIFSDLDGRLDARIGFDQETSTSSPHLHGSATVSDGLFQLASMGEEYHGVTAKLSVQPDGVARLDNAVAYGVTGKVTASASAHLDGLDFLDGRAVVQIAKKEALPLEVNGSIVGDVYGTFNANAKMMPDKSKLDVVVDVPVMHLKLPPATSRTVQTLDEPANTHVGFYDHTARHLGFVNLPIDGEDLLETPAASANAKSTEVDIAVTLGNDILVERGTNLSVELAGGVNVKITDATHVSGQIQLRRGSVDVQGKPFEIERGTITFVGDDPSNPQVVITAGWTAPDGTRINADFTGTVKTGKVTLRSSPSRPNNEILALILFGTADGSSATPYAQPSSDSSVASSAAAGAAGGTVTQGINRALDSITGLAITTKIDTSQPNPRPEVELQVAKNVSLEVAIVLGTPPPGTNQDLTYVTMEWRFAPRWSLATTFGDKGSSIGDVVWQYRY